MRGVCHDMHRIGFRRALPLAFTLLHVVLVWFSLPLQPRTTRIIFHDSEQRAVAYQDGTGVPVETLGEPPPLKPVEKMALIVELPAMFVAMLIGAVLFPRNDAAWLYTSVPLVPLVWYAIGRWLDKVVRTALTNAGSIAALMLTTEALGRIQPCCVVSGKQERANQHGNKHRRKFNDQGHLLYGFKRWRFS
jgi:hypothetical protein